MQQAWAITNNVNVLGASANDPQNGMSGSGIFAGNQGALKSGIYGTSTSEIFVSEISKEPGTNVDPQRQTHAPDTPAMTMGRDKLENFIVSRIHPALFSSTNSCRDDFCCNWSYAMQETTPIANTVTVISVSSFENDFN